MSCVYPSVPWNPRFRNRLLLSSGALVAALAVPGTATAQAPAEALPEITVSSHQVPVELSRTGTAVTVMRGDDLRARGVRDLAEALRDVPGVNVAPTGSAGTLTQVRIRGADSNHILVLVDGVPMNRLDAGDFDFANFGLEAVERVEVLRGPQSGLYGSNAQAGVISITTKSGRGLAKPQAEIFTELGSRKTGQVGASARGSAGPFYGAVTVQHMNTAGYNIARAGNERDGHRHRTVTAKFGMDLTPQFNVEGVVRNVERATQYDQEAFPLSDPPVFDSYAFDRFKTTTGHVAGTLKLFDDRWIQRASWGLLRDTYVSDFGFPPPFYTTHGRRERMDYRSSFLFDTPAPGGAAKHTVSVQVDREIEHFEHNNSGFPPGAVSADRSRRGLAGEYLLDLPFGLTVSAAARRDWNDVFQDANTWRLTASQRFASTGTRLHATAGTGITNPSFTEQFGAGLNFVGNPALKPEHSFGWDVGVEQAFLNGKLRVDVTYFQADVTDQIVNGVINGQNTAVNALGVSHRKGVEATGHFNVFDWLKLSASYTYLKATRPDGTPEPRRPPHTASGSATVLFLDGRGRFTTGFHYNASREDRANVPAGNQTRVMLSSYNLVSAMVSYDVTPWATAYVRAENLFNKSHEDVYSYRGTPFGAFAGLRVKLGH